MGFFGHSIPSERSSPDNGFERHEIKTYQRKGDQVRSEYERLNPDGTVTKSVAYGNVKEGLKYRSFQMFQDGTIREVAPEQTIQPSPPPRAVAPPPPPPPQPAQQKVEPRKSYSFIVEPKSSSTPGTRTWRIRPTNAEEKKSSTVEIPAQPAPQPKQDTPNPWWYESIKEAFMDSPKQEERAQPKAIEEPERKVSKKNIFDIFNDDFFFMKPKHVFKAPKATDPFDMIEDSFSKSFLGDISKCPFLSSL